ncbi:hypothetical protein CLV58_109188 [Spirosoma oryzae]|uniref:DUF559 domain-containing protein n=1 Tax=Spirosoma oryzae TaxID=1469603 RepID=A0A2T0SYE2_9BACT|nr:hypothetical protein [Spirosoma oryzae]PRY38461.1 hypothetical protein CLV58_109188 [Spirosoma oryzae]
MGTYPLIVIPSVINKIILGDIPINPPPRLPTKPTIPTEPKKPDLKPIADFPLLVLMKYGSFITGFASFIIFVINLLNLERTGRFTLLPTLLFIFFGWRLSRYITNKKLDVIIDNQYLESNYESDVENYKTFELPQYQKNVQHYRTLYDSYKITKKRWEEELTKREDEKYKASLKTELITILLKGSKTLIKNKKRIIKGTSEELFLYSLNTHFPGKILTGFSIPVAGEDYLYTPDFILFEKELNLYIDIEIDEPYVGRTGEPIHFIESSDQVRDACFIENNWIVVRFTEKQVYGSPTACCHEIARVVNQIKPIYDWADPSITVTVEPQWTLQEAIQMAKDNSRNKYLPFFNWFSPVK